MFVESPVLTTALDRIKSLHPKTIDLSLDRVERLLGDLGSPHLKVPPVIHVAGTNGKGSVIAFMRAVLEASGYTVHVYTSPHLVSFTERIRLSGDLIDPTLLAELIAHIEAVNGDAPITFFEITTAAAYLAFAQIPADVLLLETGLGGRLDATNVVPHPQATVLTPISMDHMSFLGDSLAAIAAEKAAIMKPGVPCISAEQRADAAAVIEEVAASKGVDVYSQDRDWTIEEDPFGTVRYADSETEWSVPRPRLAGPHQISNLGTALATLARTHLAIPSFGLRTGMRQVEWPARCQPLKTGPFTRSLPLGWDLWLDGGHNPSAGEALAAWLTDEPAPTVIICGMMGNKDLAGFLEPLATQVTAFVAVPIPGHDNCAVPDDLAGIASNMKFTNVAAASSVEDAMDMVLPQLTTHRGRILICGSLYLAGEILKTHG